MSSETGLVLAAVCAPSPVGVGRGRHSGGLFPNVRAHLTPHCALGDSNSRGVATPPPPRTAGPGPHQESPMWNQQENSMKSSDIEMRLGENNRLEYLGHPADQEGTLKLLNGWHVEPEFYFEVIHRVFEILDGMESGIYYTAEELCGADFWRSIDGRSRKLAGACIADATRRSVLPLVMKPYRRGTRPTMKYRLANNQIQDDSRR